MPKNVVAASVVYGSLAWALFAGLATALCLWGDVLLPWAVAAALVVAGVAFVREARASGDGVLASWVGAALLWAAALYVSGVLR